MTANVCGASKSGFEYLLEFEFIKAGICTYADSAGVLVVGALVYGAISMRIYIRTGSFVIPFVLLLTTGGAVMTQVAPIGTGIAMLLLLTVAAGTITFLYYRYS